jgi:4-diphosphocytidyl-2-C-methyl-D-erythritol kinase
MNIPIPLTLPALAKVNLFLHVTGRRQDGYHLLDSLVAFADCGETVTLTPAPVTQVTAHGPYARVLPLPGQGGLGRDSLSRALAAFEHLTGSLFPCHLTVHKEIPAGAGLGGGSADAAAVLRGLVSLSGRTVDPDALTAVAAAVGADVPVCLLSRAALMCGIGEQVTPCPLPAPLAAVLVNPGVSVATAGIFARLRGGGELPVHPLDVWKKLSEDTFKKRLLACGNDLQAAAIQSAPVIATVLEDLSAEPSCWLARMTGSGSTCFGLFDSLADAQGAAQALSGSYPWVKACPLS